MDEAWRGRCFESSKLSCMNADLKWIINAVQFRHRAEIQASCPRLSTTGSAKTSNIGFPQYRRAPANETKLTTDRWLNLRHDPQ
jgi:hypothetical protein